MLTTPPLMDETFLLQRYHVDGDLGARQELVERMLPFVRHVARRYANRGEQLDDLVQVGCVGLLKAIDRFDLSRGVKLTTFAEPNVAGEIKRHFRDRGWSVRMPRDLQELSASVTRESERLSGKLGRAPTASELAERLNTSPERVVEALLAGRNYNASSLDETDETGSSAARPRGRRSGVRARRHAVAHASRRKGARAARAADRLPALLRRSLAAGDRTAARHLADARSRLLTQFAGAHARGAQKGRGRDHRHSRVAPRAA